MYLPTCVNLKEHGRKGGSGTQLYFEFTSSSCPHLCVFFKKFLFLNIWMYQEGDATPQIPLLFVLHESMRASLVDVSHWVCGAPLPPHIFLPHWKKIKIWLCGLSAHLTTLSPYSFAERIWLERWVRGIAADSTCLLPLCDPCQRYLLQDLPVIRIAIWRPNFFGLVMTFSCNFM